MEILQFRGFEPESGLKTLLKKSLIKSYGETWVYVESLLINLGKHIVKEKSPKEPSHWSRLWDYQDFFKVLSENKATENLEAIIVQHCSSKFLRTTMKVDALSKMNQLKLLVLKNVKLPGTLNDLSNELTHLTWNEYPFKCLPSNFQPNNLVELFMCHSNIKRLWKETKPLPNLKYLDLSHSKNLVEMPNFGEAPNIKELKFEGCVRLRKISSSVGLLRKLTLLNLKHCKCLDKMTDFRETPSLKWLNFEGCIKLGKIHPSVGSLKQLTCLNLKHCKNLVSLPASLLDLKSLEYLCLSGCSNLYNTQLLEETRGAKHFKKHCIGEAPIHSPSTSSIEKMSLDSASFPLLSLPSFLCMRDLDLSFCNLHQIPDAIGNLSCLERLNLSGNKFAKMPTLKKLSKLLYLNLEHCKQLKYLFELPSQTDFTSGVYSPPWEIESNWRVMGLYIFNCPELVESEEWKRMSISWMIQTVQANLHRCGIGYHPFIVANFQSVIPGNEIPRWFNNQHVGIGDSLSVDATSHMQDGNNWIGVAFCAVFVSHHKNNSILNRSFPETTRCICHCPPVLLDVDLVTHNSDHMCLFYFSRPDFILLCAYWGTLDFGDIKVQFDTLVPDWQFEVKKYGYRWVYEQDLQSSHIAFKHCKNSSNRKRKFLEIKEKQQHQLSQSP